MAEERDDHDPGPVFVIEAIPVAGDHEVDAETIAEESIPTPSHLRICAEIGRGGMGRVHPATDRNLLRHVALKRLDKKFAKTDFYRDGFVAEAQITGQLEHPNIIPVHELSLDEFGTPYFTMKLVQGVSLDDWLHDASHRIGTSERLEEGLDIFIKVCDALAYAHHRGVIHRDIKPANIMVADFGQVYLMDWGLARLTKTRPASGEYAQMEARGAVGTPEYMAPEQAGGIPDDMDERSDIFGLGAVLYEIVSGRRVYGPERDQQRVLSKAKAGEIVPIDRACMGLGIARQLRAIVAKSVEAETDRRYQTVEELRRDIQQFLRGGLHLPRKVYPPGSTIIHEGDAGDAAYMIVSGSCRAFRRVGESEETLGTMEVGDVFGEMALLLDEPRAASVEATTTVAVLVLDKQTMEEGLGVNGWTGALVRALAQRFRALELSVRRSGIARN